MVEPDGPDAPEITLENRIDRLEHELAALKSERETELYGWPNVPTQAQGFLAHRYQRRDAADNQGGGGIPPAGAIPEAPADGFYYGRHDLGWAYVAPLDSPAFTGQPTAPTPPLGNASTRLATTQFVMANSGGGGGGIPEAPDDTFTYGRHQYGWVQVGPLDSPAFTGAPTAPTPPQGNSSTRLATTQFVTENPGGVPDAPTDGSIYGRGDETWTALEGVFAPLVSPAFTGNPTAPTPATGETNTRLSTTEFVARDFLPRAGGQLTGPLISQAGNSTTNLGLAVGDNSTGFYRPTSGVLVVASGGAVTAQFMTNIVAFFLPLNMGNQLIQAVADPTVATDALNLRTADARYLRPDVGGIVTGPLQVTTPPVIPNDATNKGYVDTQIDLQRTSPSVVHDIPANVTITGNDQWQQLAIVRMAVQRGGNSRYGVTGATNASNGFVASWW